MTPVSEVGYERGIMKGREDEPGAKPNGREAQRKQTRQRVYAAAIAEFKRAGMAGAGICGSSTAAVRAARPSITAA